MYRWMYEGALRKQDLHYIRWDSIKKSGEAYVTGAWMESKNKAPKSI